MTNAELDQPRAIAGREHVQGEGLAREYVAGRAPEAVAEPQDVDALRALVRLAAEAGWAVIPWGGATQMALGAAGALPPRDSDAPVEPRHRLPAG